MLISLVRIKESLGGWARIINQCFVVSTKTEILNFFLIIIFLCVIKNIENKSAIQVDRYNCSMVKKTGKSHLDVVISFFKARKAEFPTAHVKVE